MVGDGSTQERIGRRKSVGKLPRYALLPGVVHQHGINAAVCLYAAGFVITNLHLASLGVVRFDLLSTRYILSGLLFVLFCCAIIVPLRGLQGMLRLSIRRPFVVVAVYTLGYSLMTSAIIYYAITGLQAITGDFGFDSKHVLLPSPPDPSYSRWLNIDLRPGLKDTVVIMAIGITLFAITNLVVWLASLPWKNLFLRISGRQRSLTSLKGASGALGAFPRDTLRNAPGLFVHVFMFLLVINLAFAFLQSIGIGDGVIFGKQPDQKASILYTGWGMFFGIAFALYVIAATFLLSMVARAKYDTPDDSEPLFGMPSGAKWLRFQMWILVVCTVFPLYCLFVYPAIPQQAGGGRIVRVEVVSKTPDLLRDFKPTGVRTYLVDRTAGTTLFLVVSGKPASERIVEVANSEIACITYKP